MSIGTASRAVSGAPIGPGCMLKRSPTPGNVRHGRPARRSRCSPPTPLISTMTTRRTPEVRPDVPDDALSCRKRLYAFRIDGGSGPEQPGAVRKDLRGPAYPHPRTGHRGASNQKRPCWRVWRDPRGQGRDFYWLGTSSTGPGLICHHNRRGAAPGGRPEGWGGMPYCSIILQDKSVGKGLSRLHLLVIAFGFCAMPNGPVEPHGNIR